MGQSIHSMMDDPSLVYDDGTGRHLQGLYQSCQSSLDIYGQGHRLPRPARDGPSMSWGTQPTTGDYGSMPYYGSMGQGSSGQYGSFPQTGTAQYGSMPHIPLPPTQFCSGFSQFAGGFSYGGGPGYRAFYMAEGTSVGGHFPTDQFQPYTHPSEADPSHQMPSSYQDTYGLTQSQSVPGLDDFHYPMVEEAVPDDDEEEEEDEEEDEEGGEEDEEGGEEDEEGGEEEGDGEDEDDEEDDQPEYEIRHDPTHQRIPQTQHNTRPRRTIIRPRCGTGGHKFH